MTGPINMGGNDILNADISAIEVDPTAWKNDGSNTPTAPMSGGNQDFTNLKTVEVDPGTGTAYKFDQIYGVSLRVRPLSGSVGFMNITSPSDAGTQDSGYGVARRSGVASGPIEYFSFLFRASPDWYALETTAIAGGADKPIVVDHLGDGTPEWRWETDGSASAENNDLNNVGALEIDPGSGTKFNLKQLTGVGTKLEVKPSVGAGRVVFSSGLDNGSQDNFVEVARRAGASGGPREAVTLGYQNSTDSFYLGTDFSDGGAARNLRFGVGGATQFLISAPSGLIDFQGNPIQNVGAPTGPSFATNKAYVDSFVFGNEVQTAESLAVSTTTLGTYQTKLQLITPSLPAGDYYIAWSADIGNTNGNGSSSLRFLLDGATTTNEASGANGWIAGGYMAAGGHTVQNFGVGARTMAVQYLAGSQTAQIRNTRIAIWRIN
jgi:hypothetical protein